MLVKYTAIIFTMIIFLILSIFTLFTPLSFITEFGITLLCFYILASILYAFIINENIQCQNSNNYDQDFFGTSLDSVLATYIGLAILIFVLHCIINLVCFIKFGSSSLFSYITGYFIFFGICGIWAWFIHILDNLDKN